jgi:tetratricopeptide (TPR) repeat protein
MALAAITLRPGSKFSRTDRNKTLYPRLLSCVALLVIISFPLTSYPSEAGTENSANRASFAQGQQDLLTHRDAEALEIFRHLLAVGVKTAPVYSNLGVAYLRAGQIDQAVNSLEEAKQLAPNLPGIDLNLGLARYHQREYALAVGSLTTHLKRSPDSIQARFLKAVCSYMMNDYQSAASGFMLLSDSQFSIDYFFMLGISLGQLKRKAESEEAFAKMIAAGADGPEVHVLLAQADLALHESGQAENEIAKAMAIRPDTPFAHYFRGRIYETRGEKARALKDFEQETKVSPQEVWAFEHVGAIRLEQGDSTGAVQILQLGLAHNPRSAALMNALARAYLLLNDFQAAVELLQRAIEEDPQNGGLHYQLARAYKKTGQDSAASNELLRADRLYKDADRRQVAAFSEEQRLKQSAARSASPIR